MPPTEVAPVIAPVSPRATQKQESPKAIPIPPAVTKVSEPPPSRPAPLQTAQTPVPPKLPVVPAPSALKPVAPVKDAPGRLQIREQTMQAPVKPPPAKPSLSVGTNAPSTGTSKLSPGVLPGKPLPISERGAPPPSKSLQAPQHPKSHASRVVHTDEQRKRDPSPGLAALRGNNNKHTDHVKNIIAEHEKNPIAPPKQPPSKHLPPARPGTKPTQPPPSGHWR